MPCLCWANAQDVGEENLTHFGRSTSSKIPLAFSVDGNLLIGLLNRLEPVTIGFNKEKFLEEVVRKLKELHLKLDDSEGYLSIAEKFYARKVRYYVDTTVTEFNAQLNNFAKHQKFGHVIVFPGIIDSTISSVSRFSPGLDLTADFEYQPDKPSHFHWSNLYVGKCDSTSFNNSISIGQER
ncbi:MAG: hypothetical protein HQL32_18160, partial [Planctomycetes bacterium]|nr:hypothetical protein [Planctomycetota bacterium]